MLPFSLADRDVGHGGRKQFFLKPQQAMFVARAEHHHDRITDVDDVGFPSWTEPATSPLLGRSFSELPGIKVEPSAGIKPATPWLEAEGPNRTWA